MKKILILFVCITVFFGKVYAESESKEARTKISIENDSYEHFFVGGFYPLVINGVDSKTGADLDIGKYPGVTFGIDIPMNLPFFGIACSGEIIPAEDKTFSQFSLDFKLQLPVKIKNQEKSYAVYINPYGKAGVGTNFNSYSFNFSAGMEIMGKSIFGIGAAYKWLFVYPITKSMNKYNIQQIDVYIIMSASGF